MPLVFYGTKSVTFSEKADNPAASVPVAGRCPECGEVNTLVPKRVMRFCHIFWIPLIPISKFKHVLECQSCKGKFVRPSG